MVLGEPNWRLIARLEELAEQRSLTFALAYSDGRWMVKITGLHDREVTNGPGDFDFVVQMGD